MFAHTEAICAIGASGTHVDAMPLGKREGSASDNHIAFMLQDSETDDPHSSWWLAV